MSLNPKSESFWLREAAPMTQTHEKKHKNVDDSKNQEVFMKHKGWFIFAVAAVIAVAGMLLYVSPADAGKLDDAIAQTPTGTGQGHD